MKKWIGSMICMVLLAVSLPVEALANTYVLDPVTGEPVVSDSVESAEDGYYVFPDGGMFSADDRRYVYTIAQSRVYSNIPNEGVFSSGQIVSIQVEEGVNVSLFHDGDLVTEPDLTRISEPGSYVLNLSYGRDSGQFVFEIIDKISNSVEDIMIPDGFVFENILLDGVPQEFEYANFYVVDGDGTYDVTWICYDIDQTYNIRFTLDKTPPALVLTPMIDGQISGPVIIDGLENGEYIELTYEGQTQTIRSNGQEVRQPGRYRLTAYDQVGNSSEYEFNIQFYLDINAGLAISLLLAAVVAVFVYCRRVRKNARVG